MNLEDKFKTQGSSLTGAVSKYNALASVQVPVNVFNSDLDLNGVVRRRELVSKQTTLGLQKSNLDLNGQIPKTAYLNNLPERGIDSRVIDSVR
jgi:hypothetical protein